MKFFKNNNKALTFVELVVSVAISSILFLIIFVFITNGVGYLKMNEIKISSVEQGTEFKNLIQNYINSGYAYPYIIDNITRNEYEGSINPNNVLYLRSLDLDYGILIGIVDINTRKLQRDYIYGNNFLGYRYLTRSEMDEIELDNSLVFDKIFTNDKIFQGLRMIDFKATNYNDGDVVNIYFKVINLFDDSLFLKDFADFYVDNFVIDEYNLFF